MLGANPPWRQCGWYLHSQERIHFQKTGERNIQHLNPLALWIPPTPSPIQRPHRGPVGSGKEPGQSPVAGNCSGENPSSTGSSIHASQPPLTPPLAIHCPPSLPNWLPQHLLFNNWRWPLWLLLTRHSHVPGTVLGRIQGHTAPERLAG